MTEKQYSGYQKIADETIEELDARAIIWIHEKSGAKIMKMENDDDNKTFGIGFRTPPNDSTGVAHIVEHCVLSGSRKYKTREPFMDLYKGSLKTFLNAMTFSDKTIYPVASRNHTDFRNLMDVYLDAVFYPSMSENKNIFMQEGWHLEIFNPDEELSYRGVVYNEMKGALSSPEDQISEAIQKHIYPDSIYGNNSGGNPYEIPNLSYEDFLAFHQKYYHPSNAYLFLYGDGDTEDELAYLDRQYLSHFDRMDIDSSLSVQQPFTEPRREEAVYSVTERPSGASKDYLTYSTVVGQITDPKDRFIAELLRDVLIDSEAAPIKRAILDSELAEDVLSESTDGKSLLFSIVLKNMDKNHADQCIQKINETLQRLIRDGIDQKLLLSCLNKAEYSLRESGGYHTKGVVFFIQAMSNWLYDEDPIEALRYNEILRELREGVDKGIFERFIEEKILNNPFKSILVVTPSVGYNERRDREEREKLRALKAHMTEEQIQKLIKENESLRTFQLTDDSKEAKATIPMLELKEVKSRLEEIPREVIEKDHVTFLYHDLFTSDISYIQWVFDISHIALEDFPYVALICEMLGAVDTATRDYSALNNEIFLHTGGIRVDPKIYDDKGEEKSILQKIEVSTKIIGSDFDEMMSLVAEILQESLLNQPKRLKELVQAIKSEIEMSIYPNGNAVVMSRLRSYFSKASKLNEALNGLDFFFFIQELEQRLNKDAGAVIQKLEEVYQRLFHQNKLIVNFTGNQNAFKQFMSACTTMLDRLEPSFGEEVLKDIVLDNKQEGILSSSNVQYVSKGTELSALQKQYNGTMAVLASVLSLDYLHNNIRAKGGAYGAGIQITENSLVTYSYRDPNLEETLEVYDHMGDFLRSGSIDQRDLHQYIIGTLGAFDPPMTTQAKGKVDLIRFMQHRDVETIERWMEEATHTTTEQLASYAEILDQAMAMPYCCVLGNKEKVMKSKDHFKTLLRLQLEEGDEDETI